MSKHVVISRHPLAFVFFLCVMTILWIERPHYRNHVQVVKTETIQVGPGMYESSYEDRPHSMFKSVDTLPRAHCTFPKKGLWWWPRDHGIYQFWPYNNTYCTPSKLEDQIVQAELHANMSLHMTCPTGFKAAYGFRLTTETDRLQDPIPMPLDSSMVTIMNLNDQDEVQRMAKEVFKTRGLVWVYAQCTPPTHLARTLNPTLRLRIQPYRLRELDRPVTGTPFNVLHMVLDSTSTRLFDSVMTETRKALENSMKSRGGKIFDFNHTSVFGRNSLPNLKNMLNPLNDVEVSKAKKVMHNYLPEKVASVVNHVWGAATGNSNIFEAAHRMGYAVSSMADDKCHLTSWTSSWHFTLPHNIPYEMYCQYGRTQEDDSTWLHKTNFCAHGNFCEGYRGY